MHELLERLPLCIGTVYLCRMFSSTNIYKPVIQLISLFLTNVCFFLPQDFSQCQLSAGFAQKAQPVAAWGSPCHWVNCCRSGLVDGWSFRWALLTCLTGIQGWEMWESGERWNLLIIRFTSILKIDDLSLSLSLQGLVQLLSSAIWSFKGPGPVDSMAGFAWLNFIFPLYLQHEVLRTSLGYTKDPWREHPSKSALWRVVLPLDCLERQDWLLLWYVPNRLRSWVYNLVGFMRA